MELIIDIPDSAYKVCYDLRNVGDTNCLADILVNAVGVGTPIPDNATVGEVFCMLACKEPICETASYFTIDKNLWNRPYQKGGK